MHTSRVDAEEHNAVIVTLRIPAVVPCDRGEEGHQQVIDFCRQGAQHVLRYRAEALLPADVLVADGEGNDAGGDVTNREDAHASYRRGRQSDEDLVAEMSEHTRGISVRHIWRVLALALRQRLARRQEPLLKLANVGLQLIHLRLG